MLAVIPPIVSIGRVAIAFLILSAAASPPFESTPGSSMLNSSPPMRAAVSIERASFFNISDIVFIAKSPY